MITLTRLYRFPASHRLHSASLSDAENERVYGKCNNPFGHGHDYILEVTAAAPAAPATGRLVPIAALDLLVEEQVLRRIAHRNLNLDVPEFASLVPTTENIALTIAAFLGRHWDAYLGPGCARLARIYIQETPRNSFEVLLAATSRRAAPQSEMENVHA
jgi:6-pyruvoyltetrahydropterin/6-carboxytetrahydropterin synthase